MDINFDNIEYLKIGNNRQQQAYEALTNNKIFSKLKMFDPILVGTIPINIDIENSDLDVICYFEEKQHFQQFIIDNFKTEKDFRIVEHDSSEDMAVVANFFADGFEIEIFGQNIPTKHQFAYRHLIVENLLLNKYGEEFRNQIIQLKQEGHKTEPAFAIALGLAGDPYTELLKLESDDGKIK
jgi:hypothetical protein